MTLLGFKTREEVRLGDAEIWTCISGTKVEKFSISITKLEQQSSKQIKGISFEVTDEELLEKQEELFRECQDLRLYKIIKLSVR